MTMSCVPTPRHADVKQSRPDYGRQFEVLVAYIYNHIVAPGSFVVDGGANAGLHAVPLSRLVQPGGRIVCFEPGPTTIQGLRRNLASAIEAGIADVRQEALGNAAGEMRFMMNSKQTGHSRLALPHEKPRENEEDLTVKVVTLDDVLPIERVDFIKLDLEGFDFNGIRGGRNLIARGRPPIIFENSRESAAKRLGYTASEFFAWFGSQDYVLTDLHNVPLVPETWADKALAFEFIAIHRADPRRELVRRVIHHFWTSVSTRQPVAEWRDCVWACRDAIAYVGLRISGHAPP